MYESIFNLLPFVITNGLRSGLYSLGRKPNIAQKILMTNPSLIPWILTLFCLLFPRFNATIVRFQMYSSTRPYPGTSGTTS